MKNQIVTYCVGVYLFLAEYKTHYFYCSDSNVELVYNT